MATQADVGEHLDLSPERVRQLVRRGVLPEPAGRGSWDVDGCRIVYLRWLREQAAGRGSTGPLDLVQERARESRERADKLALENRVTRAELIPVDAVAEHWGAMILAAKRQLRSVPDRFKMLCPSLSRMDADRLRDLLDDALRELAGSGVPGDAQETVDTGILEP